MKRCEVDQAVFYRVEGESVMVLASHIDDCLAVASSVELEEEIKRELKKAFKISDLGEINWILGITIKHDHAARTIGLSQKSYINSMLSRCGFENIRPITMPMDPSMHFSTSQGPKTTQEFAKMKDKPYCKAVGLLMYASLGTRPNITYAVSILSKFADNPGLVHWNAVKRVFAYLTGTKGLWLTYGDSSGELEGYSDADGSMHEDRKAISGYAFLLDGGAILWSSKKQEIIALLMMEAEYVATTHAAKEALWLRSLIGEIFGEFSGLMTLTGITRVQLHSHAITNTTHVPSTSTSTSTSYAGLLPMENSNSSIVPWKI
jgi:Reverse transcriptase (RNA-dependent DNA polymerase)